MGTTRGLERLIFFTDAVAAIAITLLILPLVDPVAEAASSHGSLERFLAENAAQIASFFISFAVIARLWIAHHAIFEHIAAYTPRLIALSLFWALTLVLLPLPTAITAEFEPSPLTIALYIGTMALNSLTLTAIVFTIRRSPTVEAKDHPLTGRMMRNSVTTSAAFLLALVIGVLVPAINYWALLLLFLSGPVEAVLHRRARSTIA